MEFPKDNIPCIGGSWIVKRDLVKNQDWDGIKAMTADARRIVEKGDKHVQTRGSVETKG